jgi:hypothetical protein
VTEQGTRFLAWQLSENYGAAGLPPDEKRDWFEAEGILRWREQKIREQAHVLYVGKQHAPWYTAGNTPEAAVGDWLTAETMMSHGEAK